MLLWALVPIALQAQLYEVGGWLGAANYFGDVNPKGSFALARPGGGGFFRINFGTRWAVKLSASYAQVQGDDGKSTDQFTRQRNLSFRSGIAEMAILGELNFLEYTKLKKEKWFMNGFRRITIF